MPNLEIFRAREEHCRRRALTAPNRDIKFMYEDMARHYARLIKWGAYSAEARPTSHVRRDP